MSAVLSFFVLSAIFELICYLNRQKLNSWVRSLLIIVGNTTVEKTIGVLLGYTKP